jgi:hypothetical protein
LRRGFFELGGGVGEISRPVGHVPGIYQTAREQPVAGRML